MPSFGSSAEELCWIFLLLFRMKMYHTLITFFTFFSFGLLSMNDNAQAHCAFVSKNCPQPYWLRRHLKGRCNRNRTTMHRLPFTVKRRWTMAEQQRQCHRGRRHVYRLDGMTTDALPIGRPFPVTPLHHKHVDRRHPAPRRGRKKWSRTQNVKRREN